MAGRKQWMLLADCSQVYIETVLIERVTPSVVRAQARILEPLTRAQSQQFMELVALVISHHEVGAAAVD